MKRHKLEQLLHQWLELVFFDVLECCGFTRIHTENKLQKNVKGKVVFQEGSKKIKDGIEIES